MKTPIENHCQQNRYTPYTIHKKINKPCLNTSYNQGCSILKAIELNERKKLGKKCIAHLAVFVSNAWEEKPSQEKIQQVYYMINNLLDTTSMDTNEPLDIALQKFCSNTTSTPTICPSITLLVAMSYIERLNKQYRNLKGTSGCAFRMVMVAYMMAAKYIHHSLKTIIYTIKPITPPTSPDMKNDTISTKKDDFFKPIANDRIARMEIEFLHFLKYDLSVQDPLKLVEWAQNYQEKEPSQDDEQDYTSADEGDDEMDDEDDK